VICRNFSGARLGLRIPDKKVECHDTKCAAKIAEFENVEIPKFENLGRNWELCPWLANRPYQALKSSMLHFQISKFSNTFKPVTFNLYNSIMLAGITQGLIFGLVVLCSKRYRHPATLFLGCFILSFSLDNLQYYLEDTGIVTNVQLYTIFFIPFQLLSGPLFLLYGLYLLEPERKFRRSQYLLFLPFVIGLILNTGYKFLWAVDFRNNAVSAFFEYLESVTEFFSILFDVSVLIYLYGKVRRAERRQQRQNAGLLTWFRIVLLSLFLLSALWLVVTVADYIYDTEYWYAVYIGMSVIVYWMGHVGVYKFGVQQAQKAARPASRQIGVSGSANGIENRNEHIVALEALLVGERLFLDPTLTLDKVAAELDLSKSHLSRIINAELQMGFPDYLNALRVEEAKSYLSSPDYANYTLVAIGLEAGFNSKTTFNTVFKKFTSVTPSEFRNSTN
jgi:AraC-like DNA-binding protein